MTNNEARHWEDYDLGSSDYPWPSNREDNKDHTPNPRYNANAKPKRLSLDDKLQYVQSFRRLNPDGSTDVEATNQRRTDYALEHNLKPMMDGLYRVVTEDEQGLLRIGYQESEPKELRAISDEETISLKYLSPEVRSKVRQLIRDGEIRGTSSKANLSDLNIYFN